MPLEPRFGALAVAAAVQDDEGVELVQPDGRHLERVLLLDAPGRRPPLALNDQTVRPLLRVVKQEVDAAVLAVDVAPDGALPGEDGLARGDETGQMDAPTVQIYTVEDYFDGRVPIMPEPI